MATPTHRPTRLCHGCAEAQRLVNWLSLQLQHEPPPTSDEIIEHLPLLLESALADLLAEYDLNANPGTRTARAIHFLAMGAESAQLLLDARTAAPSSTARACSARSK